MIRDMNGFFVLENRLPESAGFRLWETGHLAALAGTLMLGAALCLAYRRRKSSARLRMRRILGLSVLLCELAKDVNLTVQGVMSVYYLPLHLCGLAVFFTLWHSLMSQRPDKDFFFRVLGNFLYSTCMPGALFALFFPDWTAYPLLSFHSLLAFVVHTLLVCYPLMQVLAGDLRPEPGLIGYCGLLLAGLAGAVYCFDRLVGANYMFLQFPAPGSPLEWFADLLGIPGYLLGYLPMLAVIWGLLYVPFWKKTDPAP